MDTENKKTRLDTPVQFLKGVGPARAKAFETLGILTAGDLLEYYPRDWVFVPELIPISRLYPNHTVTIAGIIESCGWQPWRRPPTFEVYISDSSGMCRLIWFHGGYLQGKLEPGMRICVCGKVSKYKYQLQFNNPKIVVADEDTDSATQRQKLSGPIYPACANLSSRQIKQIIHQSLDKIVEDVPEFFEDAFLKDKKLIARRDAFKWIHNPDDEDSIAKAKRRLKYDELFLFQTALAIRRYRVRHFSKASALKCSSEIDHRIRKRFPFLLTGDQDSVIEEITKDLASEVPMNRLLQGDVGSGKTVVALYAALLAVANKQQAVIMTPTEILAAQHFQSIQRYLKGSRVGAVLVTGGLSGAKRKNVTEQISSGKVDIVVGTVALLQKDICFKNLAVTIIDEQHKFGVHQRAGLRKDRTPHCLVMTATPIPRTLAMTAFGDLDVSVIKHSPPGRGKVVTRYIKPDDMPKACEFIRERLKAKKQAYFVYPRIVDSENGDVKAATVEYQKLSRRIFSEFRVVLLHGKMKSPQKRKIMTDFSRGKIDVLVSTVLVEVGLDVPNATIMVIEGAERFGLAQLHQLRGRIGRGQSNSYCLLACGTESDEAKARLQIMERSNNGFEIAEQDLRLRGPGEMLSTRQHGLPDLKIANIIDDFELLRLARKDAFTLVESDPMLNAAGDKNIRAELIRKFSSALGLADIA